MYRVRGPDSSGCFIQLCVTELYGLQCRLLDCIDV